MTIAIRESTPLNISQTRGNEQLRLALNQGEAYQLALEKTVNKVADDSQKQRVQDYLVTYTIGPAEGSYEVIDDELHWRDPADENIYLRIAVCDVHDQRFIPGLNVYATLVNPEGAIIGVRRQPFVWHPTLYHYGCNWRVPQDGLYTLKIRLEAPAFPRHDKEAGRRYQETAKVEFQQVKIDTGRRYH